MNRQNPITPELIAPCGMNCALCSRYLAYSNNLKRSQCPGCRPRNKRCSYLFKNCSGPKTIANEKATFCFECSRYPCKQIDRMDKRYRTTYNVSMKDNLECIRKNGVAAFINDQYDKYRCSRCGGLISIHNRKCFKCDTITRLIEKQVPASKQQR